MKNPIEWHEKNLVNVEILLEWEQKRLIEATATVNRLIKNIEFIKLQMKHANNPFNLQIGDHITIKGDDNRSPYIVIGFTDVGYPIAKKNWLVFRGIQANMIGSVIRGEK